MRLTQNLLDSVRAPAADAPKIPVLSWCCVCGIPVALEVTPDYKFALHEFIMLDRQQRAHKRHIEDGGWGFHWRLDEVLEAAFPNQHILPRWTRPPWYEHSEALEFQVRVMTEADKRNFAKQVVDQERRMLDRWINDRPKSREDLVAELIEMRTCADVWDTAELRERFEVLYYESPFVVVVDKRTGKQGSLMFQKEPRFYFGFDPERIM